MASPRSFCITVNDIPRSLASGTESVDSFLSTALTARLLPVVRDISCVVRPLHTNEFHEVDKGRFDGQPLHSSHGNWAPSHRELPPIRHMGASLCISSILTLLEGLHLPGDIQDLRGGLWWALFRTSPSSHLARHQSCMVGAIIAVGMNRSSSDIFDAGRYASDGGLGCCSL